jgi:5-methylcytosine-specific restriction endonuclease McrA
MSGRSTTKFQHLYDSPRWRAASKAFRSRPENALCIDCKARGLIVASAHTDHIVPHHGDLKLFWDPANWAPRCTGCHSSKTRADEVEARTGKRPLRRGCDASGFPLDPRHPWQQGRR